MTTVVNHCPDVRKRRGARVRVLLSGTMSAMPKMHPGRRYDLWFANPFRYDRHLFEMGESQVLLTWLQLKKKKKTARNYMRQNFHGLPWKVYVNSGRMTYLQDYTCGEEEIKGSWPTWSFKTFDLKELRDLILNPWSEREPDPNATWYERPVSGQPHRIFIEDVKISQRKKRLKLTEIQRAFPEVELFIMPTIGANMNLLFGCGFTAGCIDMMGMRSINQNSIFLPNGRCVKWENIPLYKDEINYFGFDATEVQDADFGMMFCIASYRYAAHHWDDPTGMFANRTINGGDYYNPTMYAGALSYKNAKHFKPEEVKPTDKLLCDSCSLWRKCPVYRTEEVCALPGSETGKLAKLALSRNADDVVEMLASIVSKQAERVEQKIDDEKFLEAGFDKNIDKMLNNVFKNGVQLAKLRDPSLGRAPLVQINAGPQTQQAAVAAADPRALASQVISEIEATGVKREDITEEMIEQHLQGLSPKAKQLESAEVVDAEVAEDDE